MTKMKNKQYYHVHIACYDVHAYVMMQTIFRDAHSLGTHIFLEPKNIR